MKEKIITEAIDLFSKFGFKSVTIDDIAEKMSVSKKTIYVHFPKKETLVETSVMKHFDIIIEKMIFISNHSKDPIIELYQMNKEALKHLSNEKNSPIYQLQKYYRSIYQKLQIKEFNALGEMFSKSLKRGIETGLFRPDINVDFVIRIFHNGIRGIQDSELFPVEKYKNEQLLIQFTEYHLRAICTQQGIEKLIKYKKELNI